MNDDREETGKGIKLQIHAYNALHNRKWSQMDGTTEKIWKVVHNLCAI